MSDAAASEYPDTRAGKPILPSMTSNAIAWTKPENWDGNDYVGPGLPPWGNKPRCPSVRNGRRCRKACIPGGTVCNTHGGAAPQVKRRAQLRLLSLVDPALSTLARTMVDPAASLELKAKISFGILDRTGLGKAGDVSADVAKALLMDRYYALRDDLEARRVAAGLPSLDEVWTVEAEIVEDEEPEALEPAPATPPAPVSEPAVPLDPHVIPDAYERIAPGGE